MTIFDTFTNSLGLGNLVDSSLTSDSSATETDTSSLGEVFDSFLSFMLPNDSSENSANGNASTSFDESADSSLTYTDPIESIQQGLMAAVAQNSFGVSSLDELTSDESIASLQNAFLVSLQANLFSAADNNTDATAQSTEAITDVTATSDFLGSIENLSNAFLGNGELGLNQVFDTVNVLNHIPIVADLYQETMATDVAPVAEVVGSFMYGGALGLGYSVANMAVENITGKSIYGNLVEVFFDDEQQASIASTTNTFVENVNQNSNAYQFVKRSF